MVAINRPHRCRGREPLLQEVVLSRPAESDERLDRVDDDAVRIEVRVLRVGRSSATYQATALGADGEHYYRATLVACFIARPEFKSAEIPADVRERMLAYQAACGDA